jgi:hypothetical protein
LLRRTLASQATAAEPCPDPEILAAYAERSLDSDEIAHYELHFAQCSACRDQLSAMARAAAPAPRPPRISWIWTWGWIALAPVTAVLLIAAVFIARQPKHETASVAPEPPLVAMQTTSQAPQPSVTGSLPDAEFAPKKPANLENRSAAPARAEELLKPVPPQSEIAASDKKAADYTAAVKSEANQPAISSSSAETELSGSRMSELPLNNRTYTSPQELQKAAPAPATPASTPPRGAAGAPRAQTQTVTADSDAVNATTQAPVQASLADNSTRAAGALTPSDKLAPQYSTMARVGGANQMVVVEGALDRSAKTLVQSPDPQVLWRISGGRYIERSADAGATWQTQWTNASAHVVAGSAPSADTCWLVGSGGIVLRSTDARKWHTVSPPEASDFTAVSASDAESATITTKDGRQFKTRDGGKHWTPAP